MRPALFQRAAVAAIVFERILMPVLQNKQRPMRARMLEEDLYLAQDGDRQ